VSDDLSSMYQTVTDSNGLYSLLCYQAGQYSLFVTYQNALGNRFTSDVKPFLSVGE
jgi:hypothetical protein